MANRSFNEEVYTVPKRPVTLWAVVTMSGTTPVLQKWVYPTLGTGTNVRTYTTASSVTAPSGTGSWPLQYTGGTEGVFSVTRTAAGLWTVALQDAYQRVMLVQAWQSLAGGAATIIGCSENTTITNMSAGAPGSVIGVGLLSATGTLADPATLTTVKLKIELLDATEP